MEDIPEAITSKEAKILELKETKEFKLTYEKDLFQIKTAKIERSNKIMIQATKINELVDRFYSNDFTFEDFTKLDRIFRAYDKLEEIYEIITTFFNEQKAVIKEIKDDYIKIGLKILSITGKEKIVEVILYKKEMNQDSIVKKLCDKINKLEEENKNLKEENKNIKEEINSIKKDLKELIDWKNKKEGEINELITIKKNKTFLENMDTKIITKKEDLELIEKEYKNNDQLLLNKSFKPKLLYRASRDGDSAQNFHSKCDNIKDTIILVQTNEGLIFGGYTNQTWNKGGYKKDDKAFCFSFDLKKIYHNKKTKNSIYCNDSQGPTFGDYFFAVYDNAFSKGGMMNDGLNNSYDNQDKINEINRGNQYFGIKEVEVFKVLFE